MHNSYFLTEAGLFFSSEALGLVFSATYLRGSFALLPASGGISPTDKLRKNSALTPVTSEKSILFSWVTKIVRLCKGLGTSNRRKSQHNSMWRSHEKVVYLHSTFFIFHRAFCFCGQNSTISNQGSHTFFRTGHGQKGGFYNSSKGA